MKMPQDHNAGDPSTWSLPLECDGDVKAAGCPFPAEPRRDRDIASRFRKIFRGRPEITFSKEGTDCGGSQVVLKMRASLLRIELSK